MFGDKHKIAVYTPRMNYTAVISALQLAVSPVILISAVGLLLLSMINRYAHSTDRTRTLATAARTADVTHRPNLEAQLTIMHTRTRLVRRAIECAIASALFSSILVLALFADGLLGGILPYIIVGLVVASLTSLACSLVFLMMETRRALAALELELGI